jgi:hypothetical protein
VVVPSTELQEVIALTLIFVVHVIGGLLLVWAMLDDETRAGWRRRWGRGGEDPQPTPPVPPSSPVVTPPPLPLPESDPSPVRLRGADRLGDAHPSPLRRPGHAPRPTRLPR